jgi:hypothetical protein
VQVGVVQHNAAAAESQGMREPWLRALTRC